MSIFLKLADQYAIADGAFAALETRAFAHEDESAYAVAVRQHERNDRTYFLYVFTRFESAVNVAVEQLLSARCAVATPWPERRVWDTLRRAKVADLGFLTRIQLLLDKSRTDYSYILRLYDSRNRIGHGGDWAQPYAVAEVAARLETIVGRFEAR